MGLKHLKEGTIRNLFSGRPEYYIAGAVIVLSTLIGIFRHNNLKDIFSEIQPWVYGVLMYLWC
jgi:putative Mn2+ efflux pump MntP